MVSETRRKKIHNVTVIGTGNMGHGIAQTFALKGYDVYLLSRSSKSLNRAIEKIENSLKKFVKKGFININEAKITLNNITPTTSFQEALREVDLVIDSVNENMELKKRIFSNIDKLAPPHSIISTNTSTLSITELGRKTKRPEKIVGMHWFIPPQLSKLIEIVKGKETSSKTLKTMFQVSKDLGKTPILCKKDSRGFIVSRILVAVFNEAFWAYSRGDASMLEIDSSVKYLGGFPMGWFELMDYVGLDIEYDVGKILYKAHGERFFPHSEIIKLLLKRNELGRKTKKGFYNWNKGRPFISKRLKETYNVDRSWAVAVNEASWMVLEDVADPNSIDVGMKLGTGWPSGPCEFADKKGIDNILKILNEAYRKYPIELYKASPFLKEYIRNGWIGKLSGRGFYKY